MTTKRDIENVLWGACDTFRGTVASSVYKDYLLVMLFVKYLNDAHKEKYDELMKKYNSDVKRVERALARERFVLHDTCSYSYLYSNRNATNIGELINIALSKIEEDNSAKLRDVFRNIDFNSTTVFTDEKQKQAVLKTLITDFNGLDLRPSMLESVDIIGDAYEYLISRFASDAGQKGGEFFTPSMVSELAARIVKPRENDRIYDPTCGSGSLLIRAHKQVQNGKTQIYGQELNGQTHSLCKMNMFLHSVDDAKIYRGDTLASPLNIEGDKLMKFQCVVANPPFSLDKWAKGFKADGVEEKDFKMEASYDKYNRFSIGIPPTSKGDYAFILHMLNCLDENSGRMAVVMPHGVLFRGSSEGKIRQELIKMNLLDAVIGLPTNLFYGTSIPACILVFRKDRAINEKIVFIDASGEGNYEKGKNQNALREQDIAKIISTYVARKSVDKYCYVSTKATIAENDYNLNIPRYVDTFEEEEIIDIDIVNKEIIDIKAKLVIVEAEMEKYLAELGLK